jgi:hypothetical protein
MGRDEAVPAFASEAEERAYWETHDSSGVVDWSRARRVRVARPGADESGHAAPAGATGQ